eukprot:355048-Chlamydomonas_euryale.AAC.12
MENVHARTPRPRVQLRVLPMRTIAPQSPPWRLLKRADAAALSPGDRTDMTELACLLCSVRCNTRMHIRTPSMVRPCRAGSSPTPPTRSGERMGFFPPTGGPVQRMTLRSGRSCSFATCCVACCVCPPLPLPLTTNNTTAINQLGTKSPC